MPTNAHAQYHRTGASVRQLLLTHPFDREAWESAAAQDLHVRIGNAAPVIGRSDAITELDCFFARVRSIGAGFCETCRSRETLFAELEVEFRDSAGLLQWIPCVVVVRLAGAAVLDVRLHLDPSPIPASGRRDWA